MGQQVNPIGFRLGINRTWDSRWFAGRDYADLLHKDLRLRDYLFKRLDQAGVSRIVIERPAKKARITIHTARPGVVIGKKGTDIDKLRADLVTMTGGAVHLNNVEIRKPYTGAKLGAANIVFSTDYPPPDTRYTHSVEVFLTLPFPEESLRKILWDNCARLYGLS